MAIKFLHDLDLSGQEIQNLKLHVTSSAPTAAAGAIYFDSGANVVKVHDGTSFKTLSTDTTDDNTQYSTSVVDSSGIKFRLSGTDSSTDDIEFAGSGTVSVARTNASKITITGAAPSAADASSLGTIKLFSNDVQTVASNEVTTTNGRTYGLQVDSNGKGVVNVPWTDTHQLTTEEVQDIAGPLVATGGTKTGISVTYDDANGNMDFVVASQTDNNFTTTLKNKLDNIEASADVTDTANVKTALSGNLGSATFGDSNDTITIPGNLVVTGDTTYSNETIQIVTDNTLAFRAGDGDSNEVLLTAANATGGDKTITLPNLSGHIALLASAAGGTISATPSELNIMDGVTATTAELNILDGVTATTAELNIMDGVTATASEINKLDGVTATTSELNILDGVTATATELNILDGVTSSTTELNLLDGITTLSGSNTGDEPDASTSTKGIVELATSAETQTGSDTGRAVTPDGLAARSVHSTIDVSDSTFSSGTHVAAIQHDLGTEDVMVQLFDSSTKETVYAQVERKTLAGSASTTTVRITFSSVPSNDIEVMITSIKGSTSKTASYS